MLRAYNPQQTLEITVLWLLIAEHHPVNLASVDLQDCLTDPLLSPAIHPCHFKFVQPSLGVLCSSYNVPVCCDSFVAVLFLFVSLIVVTFTFIFCDFLSHCTSFGFAFILIILKFSLHSASSRTHYRGLFAIVFITITP